MRIDRTDRCGIEDRGMVLPLVLVLLTGLWLLCVSLLSLTTITQRSSRVRLDELQAEMALQSGLQRVKFHLLEACDDDLSCEAWRISLSFPQRNPHFIFELQNKAKAA